MTGCTQKENQKDINISLEVSVCLQFKLSPVFKVSNNAI